MILQQCFRIAYACKCEFIHVISYNEFICAIYKNPTLAVFQISFLRKWHIHESSKDPFKKAHN